MAEAAGVGGGVQWRRRGGAGRRPVSTPAVLLFLLAAVWVLLSSYGATAAQVITQVQMDIRVRGTIGEGVNPIAFSGRTFDQVKADIDAVVAATPSGTRPAATFMMGPDGWADVNVAGADVQLGINEEGHNTLTVRGSTGDFLDKTAELVTTARWTGADDTDPDLHVFFKYRTVEFSQFEEFFGSFPIEFTDVWLAMSRNEGVPRIVDPTLFPSVAGYFDDGIAGTDDKFTVKNTFLPRLDHLEIQANAPSEGVTFRGVFHPDGLVADTARELGLSGEARLDGDISYASVIKESCRPSADGGQTCGTGVSGRPVQAFGLSLTATFPLAGATETLPPFVKTTAGWQLRLSVDTAGNIGAGFTGAVLLDPLGDDPKTLQGSLNLAYNPIQKTAEVKATVTGTNIALADKFRLRDVSAELRFTVVSRAKGGTKSPPSGAGASLTGTARLELQPLTGHPDLATIQLRLGAAIGGGFSITASVSSTGSFASFNDLKNAAGVAASTGDLRFDVDNFGIVVSLQFGGPGAPPATTTTVAGATTTTVAGATTTTTVAGGRSGAKLTVFVTGDTSLTMGSKTLGTSILAALEFQLGRGGTTTSSSVVTPTTTGGGTGLPTPEFLVAAKPSAANTTNLKLGELAGRDMEFDFTLPEFVVSVASKTWQIRPDELPAALKLATEGTGSDTASQILFREGVTLKADIMLDGPVGESLAKVGVNTSGRLRVEATLPLFGSPTWGGRIITPVITPQPKPNESAGDGYVNTGPFRGGKLEVRFGRDWVDVQSDRNKTALQVGVIGNIDLAVLKANDEACKAPEGADTETFPYPESCFELLKLKVDALFEKTSTATTFGIAASLLAAGDGWQDPFGVKGLTIKALAATVTVEIAARAGAVPVVTIGMSGSLEVNGRDFTLAFLLAAKPRPPYIEPQGFTFAIDRLGIDDLIGLYNLLSKDSDINPDSINLPNVRLENVYLAFGVIDNPRLCIRLGFFLAAELHVGGAPGGNVPACNQNGNLPPANVPPPDVSCKNSSSCVAAVLIDVRLPAGISSILDAQIVAKGFFAGASLGPLEFQSAEIELKLTAFEQSFSISGGMDLLNPLYDPVNHPNRPRILAGGSFKVSISKVQLELFAEVHLLDDGITASLYGLAGLDFRNPKFVIDMDFQAPALIKLGEQIDEGFTVLAKNVTVFGETFVQTLEAEGEELVDVLEKFGSDAEEFIVEEGGKLLSDALVGAHEFAANINSLIDEGLEEVRRSKFTEVALFGWDIRTQKAVFGFRNPDGTCFLTEKDGLCYLVEAEFFHFPGLCDGELLKDSRMCVRARSEREIAREIILAQFAAIQAITDLQLRAASPTASALTPLPPATRSLLDAEATLSTLHTKFTSSRPVAATCARTTLDYGAGTISPLSVSLEAYGAASTFTAPVDLGSATPFAGSPLLQNSVASMVLGPDGATCQATAPPVEPAAGFAFRSAPGAPVIDVADEGQAVVLSGPVPANPLAPIVIDWGDGTGSALVSPGAAWTFPHTYANDGNYTARVTIGAEVTVLRFTVVNVAPTVTLGLSGPATEGDTVNLTIDTDDAGLSDTHRATIVWSDGTSTPNVPVPGGGGGRVMVSHRYLDEGGVNRRSVARPITVTVIDDDGGRTTARSSQVVNNADPVVSIAAAGAVTGVDEGASTDWRISLTDAGVQDVNFVTVTWGDGTSQVVRINPSPTRSVNRTFDLKHTMVDDNPTATASDTHAVRAVAKDGDTGTGDGSAGFTVRNVAPSVTVALPGEVEEGAEFSIDVTTADAGTADTHTVTVNWGDGTSTPGVAVPGQGGGQVTIKHTYLDEGGTGVAVAPRNIAVSVVDDDLGPTSATKAINVRNVVPVVTIEAVGAGSPAGVNEAQPLTWRVTVTDPGALDTHDVKLDWADGTTSTLVVPPAADQARARTAEVAHTWADDNPTATAADTYTVRATADDRDTGTDDFTTPIIVRNVTPRITALSLSTAGHDENAITVSVSLDFADAGLQDSHTVVIDWGAGWTDGSSPDLDVTGDDVRRTTIGVAAGAPHALTAQNRYGDNGAYTIAVSITDDDTGQVTDSRTLTVNNTTPSHAIDRTTATATPGGPTYLVRTGQATKLSDRASDPGSDDLRYEWNFGDGSGTDQWWRSAGATFGPSATDPAPSPQVRPAAATHEVTKAWATACLYGVTTKVTDDDGAAARPDHVAVAVQKAPGGSTQPRSFEQWRDLIAAGGIDQATLDCYLDIAGHLSSVLVGRSELDGGAAGGDPTPWSAPQGSVNGTTRVANGVPAVLADDPNRNGGTKLDQERVKFDRALLAVLLSYADGAYSWGQPVSGGGTFGSVLGEVETIRRTATDDKAVQRGWQRLSSLG